jgi:hypothetical protein
LRFPSFVFMWIIFTSLSVHIYSVTISFLSSFYIYLNFSPLFFLRVKFNFFYLLHFLSFTWFTPLVPETTWLLPYPGRNWILMYSPVLLYNPRSTSLFVSRKRCLHTGEQSSSNAKTKVNEEDVCVYIWQRIIPA